jgi:drug/metabolite transporter (DMT)-like permease
VNVPQPSPTGDAGRAEHRASSADAYLLVAFASLCWSGNHVVGRAIADHVPPLGISTVRWLLPALVLGIVARKHLRRDWPLIRRHWRAMLVLGLTGGSVFTALQYLSLQHTTALNVSVMNSLAPLFILLAGALLFSDRLYAAQFLGIGTSLVGVLAIVGRGDPHVLAQLQFNRGDLLVVLSMSVWAIYAACLRLCPPIHWLGFLFVLAAISSAGTLPLAAWEAWSGFAFQPTRLTALAVVYVSIFPSVLAFAAWNRGVARIGANRSGPFLHLIPIYSALLASVLLGEQLMAYHIAGFVLILAGVWLAAREQPGRPPEASQPGPRP